MRSASRTAAIIAGAALCALGLAPVAQAAQQVQLYVRDGTGDEKYLSCPVDTGTCVARDGWVGFAVQIGFGSWRPKNTAIVVSYQLVDGTARAGQDYTGTSGTVTIPADAMQASARVPLIADGIAEPAETFTIRLTGANVSAEFVDGTGVGTIRDGTLPPPDCTVYKHNFHAMDMTCTSRPATQRWHMSVICASSVTGGWPYDGNIVTGNGTSSHDCGGGEFISGPKFVVAS